jgi:ABC-type uncharacterized transport system ATPase subunit
MTGGMAAPVVLELQRVSCGSGRDRLEEVDLTVRAGEIVGIAGVSGNGQTELAEVITSLRKAERGRVLISGVDLTNAPVHKVATVGVGHIPEDRVGVGLVPSASVRDNAVLRHYDSSELCSGFTLRRDAVTRFAEKLVRSARVQTRSLRAPAGDMSGGNQQRLVARREALVAERVLLAVHPTRGLDVLATQEVQTALLERRDAGCAVLLVSDDLDEVLLMSDRIVVMYEGRVMGTFDRRDADVEVIGLLMGGHVDEAARV